MNIQQAQELLASLGNNADKVADSLHEQGIVGDHRCYSCPIANFLIKNGAQYGYLSVSYMIRLGSLGFKAPPPVRSFIDSFDAGAYPKLEAPLFPQA